MAVKLGFLMGYSGKQITVPIELIKKAEALGFDSVWTAEAYGSDAVSPAAWILAQTDKIKVGTAIMQMVGRTPATTAMTAMTLDQLSNGRFIVGQQEFGFQQWSAGIDGNEIYPDQYFKDINHLRSIATNGQVHVAVGTNDATLYFKDSWKQGQLERIPIIKFMHRIDNKLIANAKLTNADALVFDLEDSVLPREKKHDARKNVLDKVSNNYFIHNRLFVRINVCCTSL